VPSIPRLSATLALGLVALSGCHANSSINSSPPAVAAKPVDSAPKATVGGPAFDGDHAFSLLKKQCDFGPRVPNTKGHDQCLSFIETELSPYVDKVERQHFTFSDTSRHKRLDLTNVIGVINPNASRKIMLLTHWDTRPTADQEIDAADKAKPILGADDGASGTAALLELARNLHAKKPEIGVVLLFVDGEDWGPGDDKMYLGARYFAAHPGANRPDYAILLDMIGDDKLDVYREKSSEELHPDINDKVWNAAAALGYSEQFPNQVKYQISDDHDSLNAAGIPTVDLIDFDYAYWHTLGDTPDKCRPESLKVIGDVMMKVIYDEK